MEFIPLWIGLMIAVPIGFLTALVGLVVLLVTKHKYAGVGVTAVGLLICLGAVALFGINWAS